MKIGSLKGTIEKLPDDRIPKMEEAKEMLFKDIRESQKTYLDASEELNTYQIGMTKQGGQEAHAMAGQLGAMIKEIIHGINNLSTSSTDLAAISQQLSTSARNTADKSGSVAAAAEEMSTNIQSVSAAMEQSTSNVSMVASATEEMTATVNEIGQSAEKARVISESAVVQSQRTSDKVTALGESAKKVGRVTETITEISEQTNQRSRT